MKSGVIATLLGVTILASFDVLQRPPMVVAAFESATTQPPRSFVIDYDNNQFLKDGQPFRYISGSLHYFRVPRVHWQDRLDKYKAAGLNAIQVYVEWSSHEPESEQYNFDDGLDLVEFLRMANQTGLLVILRPGPYIDAERDFGGFPYWLLHDNPDMWLRSSDPSYLKYVDRWWTKLFSLLTPLLYINGGPIISIQLENEYGSYSACDQTYTVHLRNLLRLNLVGEDVVLFTTDGNSVSYLRCGKIPGVYATVDFGPSSDVAASFRVQRDFEPRGPYVNSEYYTGWLDQWGQAHIKLNVSDVQSTLDVILSMNASVNMYMFHGGTNFGFTAGSLLESNGVLQPVPTSYDYDAPLSEAGDPTEMYHAVREVIGKYVELPAGPVPPATPKKAYGAVHLNTVNTLFEVLHVVRHGPPHFSEYPITFEALGQASGFVVYSTFIDGLNAPAASTSALLKVPGIRDRGYVFLDMVPASAILSRMDEVYALNITIRANQKLDILVENQGRVDNGAGIRDFKGIVSNVTLDGRILTGWTVISIPLNQTSIDLLSGWSSNSIDQIELTPPEKSASFAPYDLPRIFTGEFVIAEGEQPEDTFLDPMGWTKGVAFVNGFNLGRYWPVEGPQVTLYVPKSVLKANPEVNQLLIIEFESAPSLTMATINLTDVANVDGPVTGPRKARPSALAHALSYYRN